MTKPHVALQMAPHNFYDEGVDHVLDNLQRLGGVEEVFVYSQVLHDAWGQKSPDIYPDHGAPQKTGERPDIARVWHRTHPEYYRGLPVPLEQDPGKVYGDRDIFDDLAEPAARRGMKVSVFILEPGWNVPVRGWSRLSMVDSQGRRRPGPCPRNPDFRAWWNSGIEDLFSNHPHLGGLLFGQERGNPLSWLVDHAITEDFQPTCFCEHCLEEAHRRGISSEKAREGLNRMRDWAFGLRHGEECPDGAFTTMLRLFLEYPEILAWDKMFMDAMISQRQEIYGIVHHSGKNRQVGYHIETNSSFDPFRRAANDLSRYQASADFIKLVVYSNPNGFRARHWFWHPGAFQTWLRDVPDHIAVPFMYSIMGYDPDKEPSAESLRAGYGCPGWSEDYVYRETLRGIKTAAPVPIYAGVGIDIPPGPPKGAPSTAELAYKDTQAALRAGARGILISRDYTEMQLSTIEAVGRAIRDWNQAKGL